MKNNFTDVLVIGAGISGISSAYYLKNDAPQKSFAILEGRDSIGGTWDLFRYPGIRSDSDMYTLGFAHRPWTEAKSIADAPSIMKYLHETIKDDDTASAIAFNKKTRRAEWSSDTNEWTLSIEDTKTGKQETRRCNFLHLCTGYYNYDAGYRPEFPNEKAFKGEIIHPQKWREDLNYKNKRIVVIGSGATAITLVPAMAQTAKHITMLQRTPTYTVGMPAASKFANWLQKILPPMLAYRITRWQKILLQRYMFWYCRKHPERAKNMILNAARKELGDDYPINEHFLPPYNPWEQRLCLAPDSDFFDSLKSGKAEIITDHIDKFTEKGIQLKSGKHIDADIIISATGLNMQFLGGIEIVVDGKSIDPHQCYTYKGMMYSDVPNLAQSFGYTNASWTLKCDLTSAYVARLLNYMDRKNYAAAVARVDAARVHEEPLLDFSSGYVQRALDKLPKQGNVTPWKLHQNYIRDLMLLRWGRVNDAEMEFTPRHAQTKPREEMKQAAE